MSDQLLAELRIEKRVDRDVAERLRGAELAREVLDVAADIGWRRESTSPVYRLLDAPATPSTAASAPVK